MVKTEREIKEIIKRFEEELRKMGIKPDRIILYGSYAKGNPREESDIDLIVVSEDFNDFCLRERLEILGVAAGRTFEPIEAIGYTEEELRDIKGTFLEEIISVSR